MLLDNYQVNEEIKEEIKKYLKTNENENVTYQNQWGVTKAVQSYFKTRRHLLLTLK